MTLDPSDPESFEARAQQPENIGPDRVEEADQPHGHGDKKISLRRQLQPVAP